MHSLQLVSHPASLTPTYKKTNVFNKKAYTTGVRQSWKSFTNHNMFSTNFIEERNKSSTLQCFGCGTKSLLILIVLVLKYINTIMFDFYPGLSHIGLYIVFREGHIIFTQNHYLLTQEYNVRKRITKHIHYAKFHGSKVVDIKCTFLQVWCSTLPQDRF